MTELLPFGSMEAFGIRGDTEGVYLMLSSLSRGKHDIARTFVFLHLYVIQ
jgi:hypothetical protein